MDRRNFIGRLAAIFGLGAASDVAISGLAAAPDAPTAVRTLPAYPTTIEELTARAEALWPQAMSMRAVAYEEHMRLPKGPAYRLVPVTLARRYQAIGPEADAALLEWLWDDIVRASHDPVFADGTLCWRVQPSLQPDRRFEDGENWTAIRCRVGILPHERHWGNPAAARQPFDAKREGDEIAVLA